MWMLSDFPHLWKCLRTGCMNCRIFETSDGIVKKDHGEALLQCENFSKPNSKLAYKLSPAHLYPVGYEKMNVPLAFELFSPQIRVVMEIYEKTCPQLKDSKPTRDFCERAHDLITAMMSRPPQTALRPSEFCS